MCPAPKESVRPAPVVVGAQDSDRTVQWCLGILMGVHRCGPEVAADMLRRVAVAHAVAEADLATATVELVRGATPRDPVATVVAMRFLMGRLAYHRPVLDGQVHASVRDAAADMHPGPDADVEALLLAADERDQAAERRDRAAGERDQAAYARPHVSPADLARDASDRQQSELDRVWAATDRDASAGDRAALADQLRQPDPSAPED